MLLQAAKDLELDLAGSFAIGDRPSDIAAGAAAGCRTILVLTGEHNEAPIETSQPFDASIRPDFTARDLGDASRWILERQ